MTGSTYAVTFIAEIIWTDPATLADLVVRAEFTFSRANNGATGPSAVTAVLSNDSHTVPSDSAGNNQIVTGASSTITVFEGSKDVTSSWSMGTPVVTGQQVHYLGRQQIEHGH